MKLKVIEDDGTRVVAIGEDGGLWFGTDGGYFPVESYSKEVTNVGFSLAPGKTRSPRESALVSD